MANTAYSPPTHIFICGIKWTTSKFIWEYKCSYTYKHSTYKLSKIWTLTSSSVFYRFRLALEPIWNFGNGQKISCLLSQIKPRFLNYRVCSLKLLCHCECIYTMASTTSTHHSRYCAKTVNSWRWPKWMTQALDHSPQVWSTLYVVQVILQILSACRQHEIQHTKWRIITHSYKVHGSILPLYFPTYKVPKKQEKNI